MRSLQMAGTLGAAQVPHPTRRVATRAVRERLRGAAVPNEKFRLVHLFHARPYHVPRRQLLLRLQFVLLVVVPLAVLLLLAVVPVLVQTLVAFLSQ